MIKDRVAMTDVTPPGPDTSHAPPPALPRPFPVYGALAFAITTGIVLIFIHGIWIKGWGSSTKWLSLLLAVMLLGPAHVAGGLGFGIVSLKRRERWRGFAIVAILLGSYPLLMLAISWMITLVEGGF